MNYYFFHPLLNDSTESFLLAILEEISPAIKIKITIITINRSLNPFTPRVAVTNPAIKVSTLRA